jgi:26S proteasome regulatory subunit N1
MLERDAKVIEESMARFACLGLGLLYLNLQEAADVMMEALKAIPGQVGQYCLFTVETCAYATRFFIHLYCLFWERIIKSIGCSGNVIKIQKMLGVCAEHLEENNSHQAVAALGIALISMGEEVTSFLFGCV